MPELSVIEAFILRYSFALSTVSLTAIVASSIEGATESIWTILDDAVPSLFAPSVQFTVQL